MAVTGQIPLSFCAARDARLRRFRGASAFTARRSVTHGEAFGHFCLRDGADCDVWGSRCMWSWFFQRRRKKR